MLPNTPATVPVAGPPPGWYPDPGGSTGVRWWNGVGWTETVRLPAAAPPTPQPPALSRFGAPAPGMSRFGGPLEPTPAQPASTSAHAAPAGHASAATESPRRMLLVGGGIVLLVLLVAAFAVKLLVGNPSEVAPPQGFNGIVGQQGPQVAAMKLDVQSVATAEETVFGDRQAYLPAASAGTSIQVGRVVQRLSTTGETVTVAVNPSGAAFCVDARRVPQGGGGVETVIYVSSLGGLQLTATSCPAAF
jgi:Protein of unknown function (DUF2510)